MAGGMQLTIRYGPPPARPMLKISSKPYLRNWTHSWAKAAHACPAASASESPLLVRCYAMRRSCCWMKPPPHSMPNPNDWRSEEHTSELQSLMRISYAVFCLKKKKIDNYNTKRHVTTTALNTNEAVSIISGIH